MKPNILFITSKGIASKYVLHTTCDTFESLYNRYKDRYNVIFLTRYKDSKKITNLLKRNNRKHFFDEIITFEKFSDLDYSKANNWEDIYDQMDISSLPKIEKVIEFGSVLSDASRLKRGRIDYDKIFKNKSHFTFLSIKKLKEHYTFITKLTQTRNIPLDHYILDPQELDYNELPVTIDYNRYFPYTSKLLDFKRDDYYLDFWKENSTTDEKIYDFVFGFTILTNDRKKYDFDSLNESLSEFNIKLFKKDKYNDIDTFVTKDEYLEYVRKSKFTLIIPSYDNKTFSAYRYIESIYNGCIPLILEETYIDEVKESLYIPDELIVTVDTIKEAIKNIDYDELINKIKRENSI